MSNNTKQIIISIIIIVVAFVGYKMYFVSDTPSNTALVADKNNSSFIDGQMILVLLNQLNKVTLDDSIFSNNVFTRLVSFEKPIADQPIGRNNPFLPIGADPQVLNTTATTTVR